MPAISRRPVRVCALVDWHNALRHISPNFAQHPARYLPEAILALQQAIARTLGRIDSANSHRVTLRLYHGWHQGSEPTAVRRVFEPYAGDGALARRFSQVSFAPGFQFGNELACDSERGPLFATYQGGGQETGQKMVDTAIACDLLHVLKYGLASLAIVVSDDDDLLPAIFTAEAWQLRAFLLREATKGVAHVTSRKCADLILSWG